MKTGLLSIHERFASQIFAGTKRFELRRRAPDLETPIRFLVYVPGRRRLAGEIVVHRILEGTPTQIWRLTRGENGISKKDFEAYFAGRARAFAYAIGKATEYEEQPTLEVLRSSVPGGFAPPQYLRWLGPDALAAVNQVVA